MQYEIVIGIDEVGRGALAGPAVVGAVGLGNRLPEEVRTELLVATGLKKLADSKKLTATQREKFAVVIKQQLPWGIGEASASEIDEFGLTAAIRLAAGRALEGLNPTMIQADAGLQHPLTVPTTHTVKGDENITEIMLASIIAKVYRDGLMKRLADIYPEYGFASHVGYASAVHRDAIKVLGPCPEHRRSFLRNIL